MGRGFWGVPPSEKQPAARDFQPCGEAIAPQVALATSQDENLALDDSTERSQRGERAVRENH